MANHRLTNVLWGSGPSLALSKNFHDFKAQIHQMALDCTILKTLRRILWIPAASELTLAS